MGDRMSDATASSTSSSTSSSSSSSLLSLRDDGNENERPLLESPHHCGGDEDTTVGAECRAVGEEEAEAAGATTSAPERDGDDDDGGRDGGGAGRWRTRLAAFGSLLLVDLVVAALFDTPLMPGFQSTKFFSIRHYSPSQSLLDLAALAVIRILASLHALYRSSRLDSVTPKPPFDAYHKNGDPKSREELDEEALEEPWMPYLRRYVSRPPFVAEIVAVSGCLLIAAKCLARTYVEIGVEGDAEPMHLGWWAACCLAAVVSLAERVTIGGACEASSEFGKERRRRRRSGRRGRGGGGSRRGGWRLLRCCWRRSSGGRAAATEEADDSLRSSLLSSAAADNVEHDSVFPVGDDCDGAVCMEEGSGTAVPGESCAIGGGEKRGEEDEDGDRDRVQSDIVADADYKAGWLDLVRLCVPDVHLILLAFVFLLAAALAQIYVPHFMGKALDALVDDNSANDGDNEDDPTGGGGGGMWSSDEFVSSIQLLAIAAILGGVFSGLRGAIFTVVGGRVNVRLRILLMRSLLSQDIAFFDVTKTGNITSRLCSDTTLVGDQVTLNVNVFLRSLVQAVGVLTFMFFISWRLTFLAFISVPFITVLSKWYGGFIRRLTKLMQKKLADGNTVSEAVLSSMSTVRAFGAEHLELKEYEGCMQQYLSLNLRSAIAYFGYATVVTSLPQLVIAVVLFYGGLLVQSEGNDHISSGQLVSFLLYLSSLSDAFNSIGSIFASLTQAVGAADKVFELMHRQPRMRHPSPSTSAGAPIRAASVSPASNDDFFSRGLHPAECRGEVSLKSVDMYYPARPKKKVLDGMTMKAPPGAVVALVGPSGGGKSSVVSLIQHLYEPKAGGILIDGIEVHELSNEWLSRHVSVVSQEPTLFARSIRRNIIYGLEGTEWEPTMDEVKEAARLANASDFIEALPHGYATDVGERGVQLSGGQKQRVAIARALVRRPRILLLDEATSALDAESEATVQEAIDGMLRRGRQGNNSATEVGDSSSSMTVIVVAHRLSTVRNADIIYVVEAGRIVEKGCHDELIKRAGGPYSRLVSRQMKAQDSLERKELEPNFF